MNNRRRDLLRQALALGLAASSPVLGTAASRAGKPLAATPFSSGRASVRGDQDYETRRNSLTWKPNIPARYPDIIVQVKSETEIVRALEFAAANQLQVVTRCSGPNIDTLRDGGMLLDVSSLNKFSIDKVAMQASIQPALISFYFQAHLARQGLSFPVPDCHTVSLGGYLLGGGYSSMGFYWGGGPACYSVLAADVILADTRRLRVSKEENADLFWALRGIGPGFFGVVTRFQLQLYPTPEVFMQSTYHYPLKALDRVIDKLEELENSKSEAVLLALVMQKPPGANSEARIKLNIRALGASEDNTRALLSVYADIASDEVIEKNEFQVSHYSDYMYNPSRSERNFSDNIWTDDRSVITAIAKHLSTMPEESAFITSLYSDRQLSVPRKDSCFSSRGRHFMSHHLFWNDQERDLQNRQWYEEFCSILWPYATSYYVNQMEGTEQPRRMKACFSEENWQRLGELREKYDPKRRFFAHMGWN